MKQIKGGELLCAIASMQSQKLLCCIARHPCLLECFSIRLRMRTHEISAKHTLKTVLQQMISSSSDDSQSSRMVCLAVQPMQAETTRTAAGQHNFYRVEEFVL